MERPASPAHLLLVDDDEGLLLLMGTALSDGPFTVHTAESGAAALAWLENNTPDLLLLDLKLADMPGADVIRTLRERGRNTPFIIITGQGDERTAVDMMKQGALDYLVKTAGMLDLLPSVVHRAIQIVTRDRRLAEAEKALVESERLHRSVLQTALDGFVVHQLTGEILEVNDALCEMTGYSREALLGMNLRDLEYEPAAEDFAERQAALREQGLLQFSTRWRARDRSEIRVEISERTDGTNAFGFIRDITEQHRLETELLEISERERRRIGHDLHDGLGQQLTGLSLLAQTLNRKLHQESHPLATQADQIVAQIREAVSVTRQLSHGLSPVALEDEGLMNAIAELAENTRRSCDIACEADFPNPVRVSDPVAAVHLYRIAQEALNNTLKHSGATQIRIRLAENPEALELSIHDNGHGFTPAGRGHSGLGLRLMDYRARLIGAKLSITSEPSQGTTILCSLSRKT